MRGQRLTAALWAEANFDDEACSSYADTGGQKNPCWSQGFFIPLTARIRFDLSNVEHEGFMPQHITKSKFISFSFDFLFFLCF